MSWCHDYLPAHLQSTQVWCCRTQGPLRDKELSKVKMWSLGTGFSAVTTHKHVNTTCPQYSIIQHNKIIIKFLHNHNIISPPGPSSEGRGGESQGCRLLSTGTLSFLHVSQLGYNYMRLAANNTEFLVQIIHIIQRVRRERVGKRGWCACVFWWQRGMRKGEAGKLGLGKRLFWWTFPSIEGIAHVLPELFKGIFHIHSNTLKRYIHYYYHYYYCEWKTLSETKGILINTH